MQSERKSNCVYVSFRESYKKFKNKIYHLKEEHVADGRY